MSGGFQMTVRESLRLFVLPAATLLLLLAWNFCTAKFLTVQDVPASVNARPSPPRAKPLPVPAQPSLPSHHHPIGNSFRCPMDCEKGKTYTVAMNCPRCGMKLAEFKDGRLEHADHTSKHGGVFFMDADNWHHVEGVLAAPGEFRLYVYDNFTQPIYAGQFSGTVDVASELGRRNGIGMTVSGNGAYLQASVPISDKPVELVVHIVLTFGQPSSLFNFTFNPTK